MKISFIFVSALGFAALVSGQSGTQQVRSPKVVLQQFIKMELEGARLTPEGRRETAHFFVRPSPPPPDEIAIVSEDYELHERVTTGDRAKLDFFFHQFYGDLDSTLRFHPASKEAPSGGIIKEGATADYSLMLTDKYWDLGPDGVPAKEVTGPPEWRIDNSQLVINVSLTTAIRYVKERRDKTNDSAIKKNADQTLTKLKTLR